MLATGDQRTQSETHTRKPLGFTLCDYFLDCPEGYLVKLLFTFFVLKMAPCTILSSCTWFSSLMSPVFQTRRLYNDTTNDSGSVLLIHRGANGCKLLKKLTKAYIALHLVNFSVISK